MYTGFHVRKIVAATDFGYVGPQILSTWRYVETELRREKSSQLGSVFQRESEQRVRPIQAEFLTDIRAVSLHGPLVNMEFRGDTLRRLAAIIERIRRSEGVNSPSMSRSNR
jgi:hypothetical protein